MLVERATVPVRSGNVYVLAAVRSAFVIVPVKEFEPAAVTVIARVSEFAVALSTVRPRIVAPPVNDEAVDVVAPRPVTVASVSASEVRNVPEATYSRTPVDVLRVRISYPPAEAVGDEEIVRPVAIVGEVIVGEVPNTSAPLPVSSEITPAS